MAEQQTTTEPRSQLRTIEGVVASDKGNKTIKVVVEYQTRHPKYGKYLKRRSVLHGVLPLPDSILLVIDPDLAADVAAEPVSIGGNQ